MYYGISTGCHVLLLTAPNRGTWAVIPNHCVQPWTNISPPVLTRTEGMLTGRIVAGSIFAWSGVDLCPRLGKITNQDLFLRNCLCLLLYAAEKLGDVLYIREGIPTSQGALSGPPQGGTDHLSKYYRSGKKRVAKYQKKQNKKTNSSQERCLGVICSVHTLCIYLPTRKSKVNKTDFRVLAGPTKVATAPSAVSPAQ